MEKLAEMNRRLSQVIADDSVESHKIGRQFQFVRNRPCRQALSAPRRSVKNKFRARRQPMFVESVSLMPLVNNGRKFLL